MVLIVVLVLLTIAIAAIMTLGDTAAPFRSLVPFRFRRARRHARPRSASPMARQALTPSPLSMTRSLRARDAESVLVTLLLAGTLTQRDYQQQMAQLAAEESARGARP